MRSSDWSSDVCSSDLTMELRTEHGSSRALLLTTLSSAWAHSQLLPLRIGATAGMSGKLSRSSVSHKDNSHGRGRLDRGHRRAPVARKRQRCRNRGCAGCRRRRRRAEERRGGKERVRRLKSRCVPVHSKKTKILITRYKI